MRVPAWISQPSPIDGAAFEVHVGVDDGVRARPPTSGSMYVVAGSISVTPAAISSSFFVCRTMAPTSASSRRLLMPRISSGFATRHCGDGQPALPVDADQVRQVVLALRVLGRDAAHGVEQRAKVEGVDAALISCDRPLVGRGVALLDDPRDAAGLADDAAVAVGACRRSP